jgi:hypothetical protein
MGALEVTYDPPFTIRWPDVWPFVSCGALRPQGWGRKLSRSSTYLTLWITQAARLRPAAWSQATVECFTVQPKLVAHKVRVRTAEAKAAELSTR